MTHWHPSCHDFCDHSRILRSPCLSVFVSHTYTHTWDCHSVTSVATSSASLMSDCVPQQEFYWHYCTYRFIVHWTKWIYELWNHSRGVMMSYHRSVLAFVAIKHTDRVRLWICWHLGMWKAAVAALGCTEFSHFFPFIHLETYFFRDSRHFY